MFFHIVENPERPDDRRRKIRGAGRLVVKTCIPAHNRYPESVGGPGHPGDRLGQLELHVGGFRVTEIEPVCEGHRLGSRYRQVAARLCNCNRSAHFRVEVANPAIAICRQRDSAFRALQPENRSMPARLDYGIGLHVIVVLAVYREL